MCSIHQHAFSNPKFNHALFNTKIYTYQDMKVLKFLKLNHMLENSLFHAFSMNIDSCICFMIATCYY